MIEHAGRCAGACSLGEDDSADLSLENVKVGARFLDGPEEGSGGVPSVVCSWILGCGTRAETADRASIKVLDMRRAKLGPRLVHNLEVGFLVILVGRASADFSLGTVEGRVVGKSSGGLVCCWLDEGLKLFASLVKSIPIPSRVTEGLPGVELSLVAADESHAID